MTIWHRSSLLAAIVLSLGTGAASQSPQAVRDSGLVLLKESASWRLLDTATARLGLLRQAAKLLLRAKADASAIAALQKLGEALLERGEPDSAEDPLKKAWSLASSTGAI